MVDSTCADVDGESRLTTVQVLDADREYLLLASSNWKSMQQIPRRYLSLQGLRVASLNATYNRPTVAIPLAAIEEIRLRDRDLRLPPLATRLRQAPRWCLQGATVGFAAVIAFFIPDLRTSSTESTAIVSARMRSSRRRWWVGSAGHCRTPQSGFCGLNPLTLPGASGSATATG